MKAEMYQGNDILRLSFEFSLSIVKYCDQLNAERKFVLSNQLLRSGTSVGANAMEAQNAESKADFIHKMKIAAKEADETQYSLTLCNFSPGFPDTTVLNQKLIEIQKIIKAILGTTKRKNPFSYILSLIIW